MSEAIEPTSPQPVQAVESTAPSATSKVREVSTSTEKETTFSNMADLKNKDKEVYDATLMSIARTTIKNMERSHKRVIERMKEYRNNS